MKLTKAHIKALSKLTDNLSPSVLGSLGGPSTTAIRNLKDEAGKELTDSASEKLNLLLDNSEAILQVVADNADATKEDLIKVIVKALTGSTGAAKPTAKKKKSKPAAPKAKAPKKKGHSKVLSKNRKLSAIRAKSKAVIDKISEDARRAGIQAMGEAAQAIVKEAKHTAKRKAFKAIDKKYAWLSSEERSKAKDIIIKSLK